MTFWSTSYSCCLDRFILWHFPSTANIHSLPFNRSTPGNNSTFNSSFSRRSSSASILTCCRALCIGLRDLLLQNSGIFPKSQSSPRWVGVQLIVSLHPLPDPPAVAVLPALCLSPNREMIWWSCEIDQHDGEFQILYTSRSNSMIYHDLSSQSYLDECSKKRTYITTTPYSFAMWFTPLP